MSLVPWYARPPRGTTAVWWVVACAVACAIAACTSYVRRSAEIRIALAAREYDKALESIDGIDASNSELLVLYERGMVLRCQGDYAGSNAAFERAELVLQDLYTRSITRELATMTTSETIAQYRGDPFEAVLVNYYKILNYLALNQIDDAMVECRRVNRKLQMLHDGGETYFVNDPFLQYLTALVYWRGGEIVDAEVSFRTAVSLYDDSTFVALTPPPDALFCDAERAARSTGDREGADSYAGRVECPRLEDDGDVTVLLETGEIVQKGEANAVIPILEDDRWDDNEEFAEELSHRYGEHYHTSKTVKYWLKVSLPTMLPQPPRVGHAVVRARRTDPGSDASAEVRAVVVEDLDAYAEQAFREKQSTWLVRAIVRGLIKYATFSAAESKDEALGTLVNILNIATETADTRSWSTLPQAIWMARLQLAPGHYVIRADLFSPDGVKVADVTFQDVEVAPGAMRFRTARVF